MPLEVKTIKSVGWKRWTMSGGDYPKERVAIGNGGYKGDGIKGSGFKGFPKRYWGIRRC